MMGFVATSSLESTSTQSRVRNCRHTATRTQDSQSRGNTLPVVTHHDRTPLAVVDHHRVAHVEEINLAVLARVQHELLPVDRAGGLDQRLPFAFEEDEIFRV